MAKKEHMAGKNVEELTKLLTEKRTELREERFSATGARAKDPSKKGKLRKSIARINTELRVLRAK